MLTRRKQSFIENYIINKNATKSAELAGYSSRTAYSQGSRLLKNVEVKEIINKRFEEISRGLEITREQIELNLWKEANNAQRSADRIAANLALAKLKNYIKDNTNTQVAIFQGLNEKDLPPIEAQADVDISPKDIA